MKKTLNLKNLNLQVKERILPGVRYYENDLQIKFFAISSITKILNEKEVWAWRENVGDAEANRVMSEAFEGTEQIRHLVSQYLLGHLDPNDNDMLNRILPLIERIDNIRSIDQFICSNELCIGGISPIIADYDGRLSVIDIRYGQAPKKEDWTRHYFAQMVAYGLAWYELTGEDINSLVLIFIPKAGNCQLFKSTNIENHFLDFQYCHDLFLKRWMER